MRFNACRFDTLATRPLPANVWPDGMPESGPVQLRSQEGAMTARTFASPLFLGFDHLEQMLERASKTSSDGYPPYNIEQTGPTGLRITLAVAGFVMDDLQITQEDNQLVIRGRQNDDTQGRIFLHRGIAARQFQRAFVLAEGIEVKGAWLDSGLLHIDLERPQPESRVKTIQIKRPDKAGNGAVPTRILDGETDERG
jgi:HSP20 family molecular chaperone IbpA